VSSGGRALGLNYVTELTQTKAVGRDTFGNLASPYTERQICDIVWIVASEHLYNLNNIGLNICFERYVRYRETKEAGVDPSSLR